MPVTQKDIARKLGVSQRLVSSALNGQRDVSEAMRHKIQSEAAALGYAPNRLARALATGRTHQVALCFFAPSASFAQELTRHFQSLAYSSAYDLQIFHSLHDRPTSGPAAADGAIFCGSVPKNLVTNYPVVEMMNDLRGIEAGEATRQDVVQIPLEEAARDAMRHLLTQNIRRIAFVGPSAMALLYEPRYRAYKTMMQAAHLDGEEIHIESLDDELLRGRTCQALEQYFQKHGFPAALFCSNDDIAIGAYRALRRAGRRIPDQTAVVGCDDLKESVDHVPSLTTISLPYEAACRSAWRMLMARLENPALPPCSETFKAHLVVRDSSQQRRPRAGSTPVTVQEKF